MKNIPFLLIYSRILLGILIGLLAFFRTGHYAEWIVAFMVIGLLTDVFDGIIARKLGVSSEKLRIWDSGVDQFFWLIILGSIFYLNLAFVKVNLLWIITLFSLEIATYLVSYIKFKKPIATHSILAKFWTLSLLWFLIDLVLHNCSSFPFAICVILGIISRLEIISIVLSLNNWATDVPSIFVVSKMNKGIPVKKSKLFNG
jgi:phosphatidylglycerophosphate synthase